MRVQPAVFLGIGRKSRAGGAATLAVLLLRGQEELVERGVLAIRKVIQSIQNAAKRPPVYRFRGRAARHAGDLHRTLAADQPQRETGRSVGALSPLAFLRQADISRFERAETRGERRKLADLDDGEPA